MDASNIEAVLSQEDQPIVYFSRKLTDQEQRYVTIKQECLAIVLGVKA